MAHGARHRWLNMPKWPFSLGSRNLSCAGPETVRGEFPRFGGSYSALGTPRERAGLGARAVWGLLCTYLVGYGGSQGKPLIESPIPYRF